MDQNQKKPKDVSDLNRLIDESESAEKKLFAEQRSNILLVSGEHYTNRSSKYWNRLRENRFLNQDQKLRITKNHVQKISKTYVNNIVSFSPGVAIVANNDKEVQDRKAAELNSSVWSFAKKRYSLNNKIREWAEDFVNIGEAIVKIIWDPNKGDFVGFEPQVDEMGQPVVDPMTMEPLPDQSKPVFSGDFVFKRVFGFNLRQPNGAQSIEDSEWLAELDLVRTEEVKSWVADDPDKAKKVTEESTDQFFVWDSNTQGYAHKKGYTQVHSMYYRPCKQYPNGYYYIFTKSVILFEGELPFGVFPIEYVGFDPMQTAARHRSMIKQLRPYQIEINRCASKIAEHQVTLGDDKLLVQSGTKIQQGVDLPGVRSMQYTGRDPIVIAGRSGEQYVGYMEKNIAEMYQVANVVEDSEERASQGADPFAQLFRSLKDKKKFTVYSDKFEDFLVRVCMLYLKLAKHYYDENFLIPMIGKNEYVNISEFKSTEDISYQIKVEPRADDLETQYGKQMVINHMLQYAGNSLEKADIGRLAKLMPFGNFDESFGDLTIDYDLATNLILALDRGEQPQPSPYDEPTYIIKKLVHRIRQPDFKMLAPEIQQAYQGYLQIYENMEVERQRKILAAQADFIPTGGPRVKVDFYVPKPGSPDKTERATLPAEAINWLVQRLDDQGSSQDRLNELNSGAVEEMADQLTGMAALPGQVAGQG